jgi:protein-disulfide isomerase
MSNTPESESKAAAKPEKKSEARMFLMAALGMIVIGGLYFLSLAPKDSPQSTLEGTQAVEVENAYGEGEQAATHDTASSVVVNEGIDVEKAKVERILGDASAPIKIAEHASFSCPHCAHFHKGPLSEFIKKYVDTGKAYIVFSDFPLNAPALHGTMIGRCIPEERYFNYVGDLFNDQEKWAADASYLTYLKSKALEYGLADDKFEACLKSEPLQTALLDRMKAVQKQWQINSTPSFVVNNQVVISGALSYEEFVKKVEEAVVKINNPDAAPAEVPATEIPAEEAPEEVPRAPETKEGE